LTCNHRTAEEYANFAIGILDAPESDLLRAHLRENCGHCTAEVREALEFWYIFAALTERTQILRSSEPTPMLRDRVINIGRQRKIGRNFGRLPLPPMAQTWLRVAAAVLVTAGAAGLSWNIGRFRIKQDLSTVQVRAEQQTAAVKKLESENNALRNLVVAARNAPAVFPGRESIVSVQDPYILRDLQKSKQTQVAVSAALMDERTRAADLEKRLSQTTSLLAAATRDREEADRKYRKAFDAAMLQKEGGSNQLSTEITSYNTRVQNLESQVGHYRGIIDSQNKKLEQHLQMVSLLQSHNLAVMQLHTTGADSAASGVALIADDSRLAFFPANLPAAPASRTYQLWIIRDKGSEMISLGTFNGPLKDLPSLQFAGKGQLTGIRGLAVTEEPIGGSPAPTGHKLMVGTTTK